MIEHERCDGPSLTADDTLPTADERSMRLLEWGLAALALLAAVAITLVR